MKRTQLIGAILSVAVLIAMFFVPESIGLSTAGIRTLGVLIAIIIALVTEPLPIGITCMLGIALMVIFGVSPTVSDALSDIPITFCFLYWFPSVFQRPSPKCPLSKRLLVVLIRLFGARTKRILLALMLCAALMSSIMSNVATHRRTDLCGDQFSAGIR